MNNKSSGINEGTIIAISDIFEGHIKMTEDMSPANAAESLSYLEESKKHDILKILYTTIPDIIADKKGQGVPDDDLVQEAALALSEYIMTDLYFDEINVYINAADSKSDMQSPKVLYEEFSRLVTNGANDKARGAVQELIDENIQEGAAALHTLEKINKIHEGAKAFKDEYFMAPTPAELANYLGVEVDDILDAIQMSGYNIADIDFESDTVKSDDATKDFFEKKY